MADGTTSDPVKNPANMASSDDNEQPDQHDLVGDILRKGMSHVLPEKRQFCVVKAGSLPVSAGHVPPFCLPEKRRVDLPEKRQVLESDSSMYLMSDGFVTSVEILDSIISAVTKLSSDREILPPFAGGMNPPPVAGGSALSRIPKVRKQAAHVVSDNEPDSDTDKVVGFDDPDSSEDSDGDWSPSDDDDDDDGDDVNLNDDGFAMFEPGKKAAPTTAKAQDLFLRKYFLEYVKSDQFDSALEALDVEYIDLDFLKIRELDPELLNTFPYSEAKAIMKKQDGALKRAEFKALRALDPLMAAWNALWAARSHPEEPLDKSKCITLVEAAVAALGQTEMELKFQRRVNIVGKVMRDFKKAKGVVLANTKILERDTNFFFGEKFQACLIKSLHKTSKLQKALSVGKKPSFKRKRVFFVRGEFQPKRPRYDEKPFPSGPRQDDKRGGGAWICPTWGSKVSQNLNPMILSQFCPYIYDIHPNWIWGFKSV